MKDEAGAAMEIMQVLEKHNATADDVERFFRSMQLIQNHTLLSTTIESKNYVEAINNFFGEQDR